ncbi:MAG: hypothetical protein QW146_04920 [Candidatus Bathyarchaeia archaeon]
MINTKVTNYSYTNIIPYIVPIIISIMLQYDILFKPGLPFHADETWYISTVSNYWYSNVICYSWFTGLGANLIITFADPIRALAITIGTFLFGLETATKLYALFVPAFSGISCFLAIQIILDVWKIENIQKMGSAFVGSLFYMLVPSSPIFGVVGGGGTVPRWPYVIFPLSFAFWVKYMENGVPKHLLLYTLTTFIISSHPFGLWLILIAGLLYSSFRIAFRQRKFLKVFPRVLALVFVTFTFNSYWLLPVAFSQINAGTLAHWYTSQNVISWDGLQLLSLWDTLDVILLGEHSYYFFGLQPQNYTPISIIIPVIATAAILKFRSNKYMLFLSLSLICGIFLTKGVNEPFGYIYYLIAKALPYGVGALLRTPFKFLPLVAFPFAFLIGCFINYSSKETKKTRTKYLLSTVLTMLVLIPGAYGTFVDFQECVLPRYKPTYIPIIYDDVNDFLLFSQENFKVMWIPDSGRYVWKPYDITSFPNFFSSKPAVDFRKIYPILLNSTDNIGDMLNILGVKYLVYHTDCLDYPNEKILECLLKQKDLTIVYQKNYTYIPADNSEAPFPEGQQYSFSDVPFKLVEPFILKRGANITFTLNYKIPYRITQQGFKGKFWCGFNIAIDAYPAGSTDESQKLFIHDDYILHLVDQTMINETYGCATYLVHIPYNYPGTAVDIYARFYDGEFKPLTPSYFVARLPVYPREINISLVIFRNEKYRGTIYVSNTTNFLEIEQISPVEWNVKVNASESFLLTFTEPYDKLWRAYVNGKELKPFPIMDLVNGFQINDTGILNIRLYYTLQDYNNVGWAISLTTFFACTAYLAYSHTKPKQLLKKLKQKLKRKPQTILGFKLAKTRI